VDKGQGLGSVNAGRIGGGGVKPVMRRKMLPEMLSMMKIKRVQY